MTTKIYNVKTTPVLDDLYDVAWSFGIDDACIDILYSNGYTSDEIEELLYDPDELLSTLEILNCDYCF